MSYCCRAADNIIDDRCLMCDDRCNGELGFVNIMYEVEFSSTKMPSSSCNYIGQTPGFRAPLINLLLLRYPENSLARPA